MLHKLATILLLSAFAGTGIGPTAAAEGQMLWKFAHLFPATHKQWTEGGGYFAKLLAKSSNGRIKIVQYPAGQLGKTSTSVIGSGLAELGILVPSYEPDKLPLSSVAELPGLSSDACEGSAKLWSLIKEGGLIDEAELKPLGLHALYAQVAPQYDIITTQKEITSLADIKSLKLRANGTAMDTTARALEAIPVAVTSSEFFDALTRGTIDGGFWSLEMIRPWGVEKAIEFALDGAKVGTGVTIHVMNRRVWDNLDQTTKETVSKAAMETQKHFCSWYDERVLDEAKTLTDSGDIKINRLSPEESKRWEEMLVPVSKSWAAELDSSGRPGTKVLNAFQHAPTEF
jgi:TRAP-type C4-dicarboxylate transport system substrate-binding protein